MASKRNKFCKCGHSLKRLKFKVEDVFVEGWYCGRCKETLLNGDDLEFFATLNGLRKQPFTTKITKIGNSYSIRLPIRIMRALHLSQGTEVEIAVKDWKTLELKINSNRMKKYERK